MRTLNRNKQLLYYALLDGSTAETDSETMTVDGETVSINEGGYEMTYESPVDFMASISFSGGEAVEAEFGYDVSAYDAIIVADKGYLPITKTSLIWYETEAPTGTNDGSTADYTVVATNNSLNQFKALLKKRVKKE